MPEKGLGTLPAPIFIYPRHLETHQAAEGGVFKDRAVTDLFFKESREVVILHIFNNVMVGVKRLNDDPATFIPPPSSTCDLGQNLEGLFSGSEIGQIQGDVGANDPYQGDVGKVVTFGNHLRAHDDVYLSFGDRFQYVTSKDGLFRRIPVKPHYARRGEKLTDRFLNLLGAHAISRQVFAPATGAKIRHILAEATIVAIETFGQGVHG